MQGVDSLVLSVPISVKDIALFGRSFPWKKPNCCPCCQGTLWWHGFVLAYFSCLPEAIPLRRLRCSGCGCVHRLKPSDYFRRFRSSIQEIKESVLHRCEKKTWRPDLPRERQSQWWYRLGRMTSLMLGISFCKSPFHAFNLLMRQNCIPVTSAKLKENQAVF